MNPEAFLPLEEARRAFRAAAEGDEARSIIGSFTGRVGVVLSGGGARGAYEAGVLLAFQDAHLPTHIIAATSVGSINAASFAASSNSLVGSAEQLVSSWLELTPGTLGIEWTRYGWMVAGLIATSAGLGNLAYYLLTLVGFELHLHHPALAWSSLALAGASVLLFYPQLPYVWHMLGARISRRGREPERGRLWVSIAANLLVGAFLVTGMEALHLHTAFNDVLRRHPIAIAALLLVLGLLRMVQRRQRARLGRAWERLVRLVLHPGLFKNFERTRYLRQKIPFQRLRHSPIRLIFTSTDLDSGLARYHSNTPPDQLARDRGAWESHVRDEVSAPDDLMPAVIASSALPITYEPLSLDGRLLTDGAVVGSQPIRPALRLGADVLFLILLEPREEGRHGGTFVDVGTRALDILMHQNLDNDLRMLNEFNAMCLEAAERLGVPPEQVAIELASRRYRYVRAFVIQPDHPLRLSIHDFGGPGTPDAIVSGYRDAARQITAFLDYARTARFDLDMRLLRLAPTDVKPTPGTV